MSARCHLCGSDQVRADSPYGSPTCGGCWPITDHIVSMQTAPDGDSLAVCRCGWRSKVKRALLGTVQDTKVRLHWRDMIRRKLAEVDAEFGNGTALADLELGAKIAIALLFGGVGVALLVDQARAVLA